MLLLRSRFGDIECKRDAGTLFVKKRTHSSYDFVVPMLERGVDLIIDSMRRARSLIYFLHECAYDPYRRLIKQVVAGIESLDTFICGIGISYPNGIGRHADTPKLT